MLPLIASLVPLIGSVLEKVIPDPAQRAKAQQEILEKLMSMDTAQIEVNKAEAQSDGIFKGGWRPACGWVCAGALFYQYLLVPLVMWVSFAIGSPLPKPPTLDGMLWELLFGLLGMGALRSFDKYAAKK